MRSSERLLRLLRSLRGQYDVLVPLLMDDVVHGYVIEKINVQALHNAQLPRIILNGDHLNRTASKASTRRSNACGE